MRAKARKSIEEFADYFEVTIYNGLKTKISKQHRHLFDEWSAWGFRGGYVLLNRYIRQTKDAPHHKEKAFLHRMLMGFPRKGMTVDHINRDALDNRIHNLRVATYSQNLANRTKLTGQYRYKGVKFFAQEKIIKRWNARVIHAGITHSLGMYMTMEEAAKAYDKGAREIYGEFAVLNFPDG